MPRFNYDEEARIYEVARKHLQKVDSNVTDTSNATIAWRNRSGVVVVVWATKTVPSPEWDQATTYYEQYNYHVALQIVFRDGQRLLRIVESHEGGRNVWDGPFHCSSCEWRLGGK